jgi:O-antigen ligase
VSSAGSSRGAIWINALDHYAKAEPLEWVFGTGLRTIPRFSEESLGTDAIGHSDLIEVLVQSGVIGLMGLILWWIVWAKSGVPVAAIVVLAIFALVNGALEWIAPLFAFLLLARIEPTDSGRNQRDGLVVSRLNLHQGAGEVGQDLPAPAPARGAP